MIGGVEDEGTERVNDEHTKRSGIEKKFWKI